MIDLMGVRDDLGALTPGDWLSAFACRPAEETLSRSTFFTVAVPAAATARSSPRLAIRDTPTRKTSTEGEREDAVE